MPARSFETSSVKICLAGAVFAAAAASAASPVEQTMSAQRQREVLRAALNDFDQAVSVAATDPQRASELYSRAAAGFTALLESGLRNAALEYNLANTYLRLGQLGRAIVHYRRALLLDPSNDKVRANLEYARRQVEPYIPDHGPGHLVQTLLFVHYNTTLRGRFVACALSSIAGWLLLALRLRFARRILTIPGLVSIVLALSLAASVWSEVRTHQNYPPAVVLDQEVILRAGRGEGYEPALRQPLGPGVELRILQTRGDWAEIRLPNGVTGWLPVSSIERV
jgi:tetratricopeptide (TPR) repeat protein